MTLFRYYFLFWFLFQDLRIAAEYGEDPEHDPVVKTKSGYIRGFRMLTENFQEFLAFQGIPFAQPPIGELRFKPPEPVQPWKGILNATYEKFDCVQTRIFNKEEIRGKEDCLYLNIYTPKIAKKTALFQVIFYIHGGAFKYFSGSILQNGPKKLIPYGVILVSFNYRLGALGFLSTADDVSPGNYGLLDQIMALRWIKNNIEYFGGDPSNITVMGVSAGGISINAHLVSPLSAGLFTKAIIQSGNILYPNCIDRDPLTQAISLAQRLNCSTSTSRQILECLKRKPAYEIISTGNNMPLENKSPFSPRFTIVIDHYVLPDAPEVLFAQGKFHKVPVITGVTKDEGFFFYYILLLETKENKTLLKHVVEKDTINQKKLWEFKKLMIVNTASRTLENAINTLPSIEKKYFFSSDGVSLNLLEGLSKFITDVYFAVPTIHFIKLIRNFTSVYFYSMEYTGEKIGYIHIMSSDFQNISKVTHGDDVRYLFDGFWSVFKTTSSDSLISRRMLTLWTNFVKYGNPSPSGSNFHWRPVTSHRIEYMKIESNLTMQSNFKNKEYKFFKEDLVKLHRKQIVNNLLKI